MPMKRYKAGSRLTRRPRVRGFEPIGPEVKAELIRMLKAGARANNLRQVLHDIEAGARATLSEAGLRDATADIRFSSDGKWTYLSKERPEVIQKRGIDSNEGYAARILVRSAEVRAALEHDLTERTILKALRLGALLQEWHFKLNWENSAISGLRSKGGGHKGSRSRKDEHLEWERYFDKLQAREPSRTKKSHYERVAERFEEPLPGVIRAIQRLKQPGRQK